MSEPSGSGSVAYSRKGEQYFEQRQLKRVAGPWKLWAMGVAAVISGAFSGWNFGLGVGGFGGLTVATLLITVMYLLLCLSLAEMGTALPHTGGAYSFARTSMGPWGGFVTGLAENMEYIFTPAVIAFFAGSYLKAVFAGTFLGALPDPIWWGALYLVFISLNILGAHLSFRFAFGITLVALAVLVVFFGAALPKADLGRYLFDIKAEAGGTAAFPFGLKGIVMALPFAVWFYLGIEELPLASEEMHDPRKDLPRGIIGGILTLIVITLLVLVLNPGIAPGAAKIAVSGEPLLDGFRTLFGDGSARLLGLAATAGLIASFHGIMYAYGRQIYSLSRAGYFPTFLSLTHSRHKTPWVALVAGGRHRVLGDAGALVLLRRRHRLHRDQAALHGGLRGDDLLRPADGLLRAPAPPPPGHRAPLPQRGRHRRRRGGRADRPGHAGDALHRRPRQLPLRRHRGRGLVPGRHRLLRRSTAATAWCSRPRRPSPWRRPGPAGAAAERKAA